MAIIEPPELKQIQEKNARARIVRAENAVAEKKENRSLFKSVLPSIGVGLFDFFGNSILQDKAQRYYKENQRELFHLQQQAQKNAASNEVEGLRQAGLSTALASGGNPMSIGAVSAPSGSSHAPAPAPEYSKVGEEKQLMLQENRLVAEETRVKSAQAALLESQKLGQDLQNENALGANYVVMSTWDNLLNSQITIADSIGDSTISQALTALRDSVHPYLNAGAYQFLQGVLASQGDYSKAIDTRITSFLSAEVAGTQAGSKSIISELAIAPLLKNNEVRAHIGELGAIQVKMLADAENAKALLPAYQKQLDKVLADIRESGVRADEIHNSDLQTALANGDWGRAGSIITEDAVKIGLNAVGFYFGGRGMAAGRAAASASAPTAPSAPAAPTAPAAPARPAIVGETKKAIKAKEAADIEQANKNLKKWYSGYKSGPSSREVNDNVPYRGHLEYINGKPYFKDKNGNYHKR